MGSVNAGDVSLYVGGGGINRAFANILNLCDQDIKLYQQFHQKFCHKINSSHHEKQIHIYDHDFELSDIPLKKMYLSIHKDLKYEKVFLDMFDNTNNNCPYGNKNNMVMIYLIGPYGRYYNDKNVFLDNVKKTAYLLAEIVFKYNRVCR